MEQQDVAQSSGGAAAGAAGLDEKSKKTLTDYIADMVAVENHIEEALDRQLKLAADDPIASQAVQSFHDLVKRQRDAMKALQSDYGATVGSPIKKAGAAVLGAAAGVIDLIRTEGISKALRDDYTAFNHAAIGYTMLHATALALGDQRVADVAAQHLRGYAEAIQRINHIIGVVVITELAKDNHQVDRSAADRTRQVVDQAWRSTSGGSAA